MNTPTPRTDAAYTQRPNEGAWDFKVRQEKTMKSLERELTAVTEQRDRLAEALNKMISICSCETEDIDTVNEIRYFVDTITKHSNP